MPMHKLCVWLKVDSFVVHPALASLRSCVIDPFAVWDQDLRCRYTRWSFCFGCKFSVLRRA